MFRNRISRRTALAGIASTAALAGTAAFAPRARADGKITVLNWQGYGTDEAWALENFTAMTGIEVVHDYFNSEQEMLTKLRTAPGVYDVVLVNNIYVMDAANEGLIQPIDTSMISNFDDLAPSLRDTDRFVMDGKHFAISWVWGVTSFAYNTERIAERPDSIQALWDPAHAGKVGWRDDALESVQLGAIATGQDMNNPADMEAIKEKLKALKSQIATFWSSEDEWNKYMAAGDYDIAVYWSGSAARSKKAMGLPVEFVVPKEGAIGWFDGLCIAADAPNAEGAARFIDFMVDPEFYVRWDNEIGAPASANTKANMALPEDAMNRVVMGDPAVVDRLKWMAPVSDAQLQSNQELWDEVKTSFVQ
jgi:spermidine/putrescine transport system substrate-binding protein